ncbi:MAG: NADH-quinone oxidoreductase subunit B [Chloroflexi bacterium]|nr:NADH-quinone oxidoreductase subunit B [Chloroflexota bacterium]
MANLLAPRVRTRGKESIYECGMPTIGQGWSQMNLRYYLYAILFLIFELFQWARKSSLWPMTFGLACCAIEMISTFMAKHDLDRFGLIGQVGATPRQSDLMIVSGTVTTKMAPAVRILWEQMPEPKWVISMGGCATCGGPYYRYPTVVQGVDQVIPVDVYIGGCPPRPEALMHGILKLQEKIMRQAKEGRRPTADLELVLAGEGVEVA